MEECIEYLQIDWRVRSRIGVSVKLGNRRTEGIYRWNALDIVDLIQFAAARVPGNNLRMPNFQVVNIQSFYFYLPFSFLFS